LIGSAFGSNGLVDGDRGNQVGTVYFPIDPKLSALDYHGTRDSRNYIPNPSSPAIDGGQPRGNHVTGFYPRDQRGETRYVRGFADIGSVERQQFPD
jgi:hypothetical protein